MFSAPFAPKMGPLDLLIIQGSPFCNIACKYCYLPDKNLKTRISLVIVEKLFERIFAENLAVKSFTVVWHAGEPLALPIEFYREIFTLINSMCPPGLKISHSFQTNGTLLTQAWCHFIMENNINIGISVDGPQFIHDRLRVKRNGKGTYEEVMRGISLLRKNEIDFHVISVLTSFSLDYPKEIFDFFLNLSVQRVGFNIEETEGVNVNSSIRTESVERVKVFFQQVFELQKAHKGKIIIREFDAAFNKILGSPRPRMNLWGKRQNNSHLLTLYGIISVDSLGNFMTFSPELLGQKSAEYSDFVLGNVMTTSFKDVLSTDKFKKIYSDIVEGTRLCKSCCIYYNVCGGGSPSNKYYENHSFRSTETIYCRSTIQTPVDIVLSDLESSMNLVGGIR
jgi:uncharacterized protein